VFCNWGELHTYLYLHTYLCPSTLHTHFYTLTCIFLCIVQLGWVTYIFPSKHTHLCGEWIEWTYESVKVLHLHTYFYLHAYLYPYIHIHISIYLAIGVSYMHISIYTHIYVCPNWAEWTYESGKVFCNWSESHKFLYLIRLMDRNVYGVASISRLLKITGLFCRISSLW